MVNYLTDREERRFNATLPDNDEKGLLYFIGFGLVINGFEKELQQQFD